MGQTSFEMPCAKIQPKDRIRKKFERWIRCIWHEPTQTLSDEDSRVWSWIVQGNQPHSPEESEQFAIAVSNADLEEDDHETCEPEPEQEDDDNEMIELVPVEPEVLVAPPSPIPARITTNKKQSSITDFFLPKKQ